MAIAIIITTMNAVMATVATIMLIRINSCNNGCNKDCKLLLCISSPEKASLELPLKAVFQQ